MNELSQSLVSIIIPTYNRPKYLKEAIDSAVKQTYQNLDIIICDNCSDISPQSIVDYFRDPRIRFVRNSHNLGMVTNIINGFKMARGKYIACLHDDDIWEKTFLQKLVPLLEANPNLALAFCDHYVIDANAKIDVFLTQECSKTWKRFDLKEGIYQPFYELGIVNMSIASANAAVIRKEVVDWDLIPVQVGGCYDLYINYLCSRSGLGAYYYPEKLTRYRQHEQTDTLNSNPQIGIRKAQNHIFCYERFMEDAQLEELQPYFRRRLLESTYALGMSLLQAGQTKAARYHFWQIIKKKKLNIRALIALLSTFLPKK
ncbi:MAG: glycosyltransferase family 2 protein [Desmonostoc vinosum HA7617-LM4]|jgi:glycosyltransferase involved in cell wall biosynthesis|nr:glycosyltransferase family 2 protein [Desmonostoc vinosum HA7617-LM4]